MYIHAISMVLFLLRRLRHVYVRLTMTFLAYVAALHVITRSLTDINTLTYTCARIVMTCHAVTYISVLESVTRYISRVEVSCDLVKPIP